MYQKSPFPYLVVLLAIVGVSCFTSLTIDKEIEQPIIYEIHQESSKKSQLANEEFNVSKETNQIAYNKQ